MHFAELNLDLNLTEGNLSAFSASQFDAMN